MNCDVACQSRSVVKQQCRYLFGFGWVFIVVAVAVEVYALVALGFLMDTTMTERMTVCSTLLVGLIDSVLAGPFV